MTARLGVINLNDMRLPYARTRWMDESSIVGAIVPLLGATLGSATVHQIVPPSLLHARLSAEPHAQLIDDLVLTASTALLSYLVARHAMRARSLGQTISRCILIAPFAGALNAGLTLATLGALVGSPISIFFGITVGTAMGSIFGIPLGLGFGLLFTPLLGLAQHERERPSHEGPDWVLGYGGVWLMLVGMFVLLLDASTPLAIPLGSLCVAMGVVAMTTAGARLWLRAAWLDRVKRGLEPGYSLVTSSDERLAQRVLPVDNDRDDARQWLSLVFRTDCPCEDYRSTSTEQVLARIAVD